MQLIAQCHDPAGVGRDQFSKSGKLDASTLLDEDGTGDETLEAADLRMDRRLADAECARRERDTPEIRDQNQRILQQVDWNVAAVGRSADQYLLLLDKGLLFSTDRGDGSRQKGLKQPGNFWTGKPRLHAQ